MKKGTRLAVVVALGAALLINVTGGVCGIDRSRAVPRKRDRSGTGTAG